MPNQTEIKFKKASPTPPLGLLKLMLKMGVKLPSPTPVPLLENWSESTPDDKYEFFKKSLLSTEDKEFDSAEIAETYQRRLKRWYDVVELREPDRVPNTMLMEGYIAKYSGFSQADYFYKPEKIAKAALKFQEDFQPEHATITLSYPGEVFDLIGMRMMRWPGGHRPDALPEDVQWQYAEGEYMPATDYDELIQNPEGYMLRKWYPRVFENLRGLEALPSFFTPMEPATVSLLLLSFAMGPVREAIDLLLKSAEKTLDAVLPGLLVSRKIQTKWGAPSVYGGITFAPFDMLGDTMRGTKGIMLDIYRHPDKLLAACEAIVPASIKVAVDAATARRKPFVLIPLHKGADGFMSEEQFAKFYWPSFKKQLEGLVEAGLIPVPFAEGSYNQRLDILADWDIPKGKVVWGFDQTDMKVAKEKLGNKFCIYGNVPASLFATGTLDEMDAYCKNLIEACAPGSGFILAPGAVVDFATPEMLHTYFNSTKKYGVYK
jgi:uroporphyrinogen-III decarboxylase